MSWWNNILKARAENWTYGALGPEQVDDGLSHRKIVAEEEYVDIYVHSLHVCKVRRGVSKFYGTVHSLISVPGSRSDDRVEFHALTTPENLKDLDAKNLHQVVNLDARILGPTPYRGGDLAVELGLFSVKSADLVSPFLSVLEELSQLAGVAFVATAKPFVAPLQRGIGLLTDSSDSNILEIGLAKTYNPAETGYFVVMRAPRDKVALEDLLLDESGRLLENGVAIEEWPYVVIRVEASSRRADWLRVPDVAGPYRILDDAVRRQNLPDVHDALSAFKVALHLSPDLLSKDADRIFELVEAQTEKALTATRTAAGPQEGLPGLEALDF
jgi:hypothetical protein